MKNRKQLMTIAVVVVVGYLLYSMTKQQQAVQQQAQAQQSAARFRG